MSASKRDEASDLRFEDPSGFKTELQLELNSKTTPLLVCKNTFYTLAKFLSQRPRLRHLHLNHHSLSLIPLLERELITLKQTQTPIRASLLPRITPLTTTPFNPITIFPASIRELRRIEPSTSNSSLHPQHQRIFSAETPSVDHDGVVGDDGGLTPCCAVGGVDYGAVEDGDRWVLIDVGD